MCFSATGSFAVSGILGVVGAASIARNSSAPHRMFAAIPFIFAAQQASEGIVWLTIAGPPDAALHRVAVATFLGLALVVWPMWLPLALRLVERNPARRRWLTALAWFGGLVAAGAWLLLTRWRPVAVVAGHSIRYDRAGSNDTARDLLLLLAYVIPTVVPFFVSTTKLARAIGATLVVSLAVAVVIQRDSLTSVWCFFAAILSGLMFVALGREQRSIPASLAERLAPAKP